MADPGKRLQDVLRDGFDITVDPSTAQNLLRLAQNNSSGGYIQWMTGDGKVFRPATTTVDTLGPGVYQVGQDMSGLYFARIPVSTEGLIRLPDTNSDKVIEEIKSFWDKEELFRRNNLSYKRGILLHGPPGSGKSATARIVTEDVVERGGIVIQFCDPDGFAGALRVLREIQPDIPVVVLMEDIDSTLQRYVESSVINLLDGVGMIDKVLFLACHTPDTRLLTRDLRWVPAGDLRAGDELWGLDENRSDRATKTGRETARRFRPSRIVSSFRARKSCVRVYLDTGESFVCTEDHPWLSFGARRSSGNNLEWTVASDLMSRPRLVRPFIPWSTEDTYESGWLAGILDGEGNIKKGRGNRTSSIGIVQSVGDTANRIINVAQKYGQFHIDVRKLPSKKHKDQVRMFSLGGVGGAASILGRVRPPRLISNFDMTGGIVQANFDAKVVRIESVGICEIQSIETTTRTYFAEGFAVHNTTNYPERLGERVVNRPSRFDRRFYIGPPNAESRKLFFKHLFSKKGEDPARMTSGKLNQWVEDTEGMSIAHLKELYVAVMILGTPYDEAIRILRGMSVLPDSEQYKGDQEEVVDSDPYQGGEVSRKDDSNVEYPRHAGIGDLS